MFRKASITDVPSITEIYENIHVQESLGNTHTGWLKGIYPVKDTALAAIGRDDMYVYEEEGKIYAAAIINDVQVDCYADGSWQNKASDDDVLVLHTLVVEPSASGKGIGKKFVSFYEEKAREQGRHYLRIDTNAVNLRARAMYKSYGFSEADIVPCVFNGIPGVNLVLLEKEVGKA